MISFHEVADGVVQINAAGRGTQQLGFFFPKEMNFRILEHALTGEQIKQLADKVAELEQYGDWEHIPKCVYCTGTPKFAQTVSEGNSVCQAALHTSIK